MKKKMNNKGFTLVELIVVLVILAILAAILVPTLMGYIDKARSEKDFSTAQSVRVAAQSIAAEVYAKKGEVTTGTNGTFGEAEKKEALKLIGVSNNGEGTLDGQKITIDEITFESNQIKTITVGIVKSGDADTKKSQYKYDSSTNEWVAVPKTNTNTSTSTTTNT